MENKISRVVLIGCGAVGCSYAYAMVNQGIAEELTLIDVNREKAEGEAMDLNHGVPFAPIKTVVKAGTYADCAKADLIVITAGLPQAPGETRLDLIDKNTKIFKTIISDIMKSGFDGLILIASNPVDVLTYVAWKESGLQSDKVFGSGTTLDTARFKFLLGEYFEVDPRNVHAAIIGEHGDTELAVWSQASIGIENIDKVLRRRNNQQDKIELENIFDNVKNAAYQIIERKGATYYAIGMALTRITKAILNNENSILPVSVLHEEKDLYIGMPAVVNRTGIKEIINVDLNDDEKQKFDHSAKVLRELVQQYNSTK